MGRPDNRPTRIGQQCVDPLTLQLVLSNPGILVAVRSWDSSRGRIALMCSHHLPLFGKYGWPASNPDAEIAYVVDVTDRVRRMRCALCAGRHDRLLHVFGTRGRRAVRRYLSKAPEWEAACSP